MALQQHIGDVSQECPPPAHNAIVAPYSFIYNLYFRFFLDESPKNCSQNMIVIHFHTNW